MRYAVISPLLRMDAQERRNDTCSVRCYDWIFNLPYHISLPLKAKQKTGQLRIIGGQWRSRKLAFPDVEGLRPTPDRVRETLFNWLQSVVPGGGSCASVRSPHLGILPGARCLDLFAGSGALGLEALSRGAAWAAFVDQDVVAARCLREHLQTLRATDAQVIQADVLAYLQGGRFQHPASGDTCASLHGVAQTFDVVFIDPPYRHYDLLQDCCARLESGDWLAPQAYIYLETESSRVVPPLPPNWQVIRSKKAGQVGYHLVLREAVSSLAVS